MIPHKNRVPTKAGKVNLAPVSGEENKYILTRADEPLEEGTPLNKEMLDEFLAASGVTTGSAASLELAQDGYVLGDGYVVRFKLNVDINDNYGTTLNINKTGAKRLKANGGYPFGTITKGTWITAIYDATENAYIMPSTTEIVNFPTEPIVKEDFLPFYDSSAKKNARVLLSELLKITNASAADNVGTYPTENIDNSDYIPFFDSNANKSAKLLLSELLKLTTKATGLKKEVARFTASGNWVCPENVTEVDVWLVGGGGGGGIYRGGGGGGGYCFFAEKVAVTPGASYSIVVGAGGARRTDGGTTTAFNKTAEGGKAGGSCTSTGDNNGVGGAGGSGGGAYGGYDGGSISQPGRGSSTIKGGKGSRDRITASTPTNRGTINPYDGIDYAGGGGGSSTTCGGTGGGFGGGAPGDYPQNVSQHIGGWPGLNTIADGGGGGYYGGGGGGSVSGTVSASYYGQGMSGIVIIYA